MAEIDGLAKALYEMDCKIMQRTPLPWGKGVAVELFRDRARAALDWLIERAEATKTLTDDQGIIDMDAYGAFRWLRALRGSDHG